MQNTIKRDIQAGS